MKFYELIITAYLLKETHYTSSNELISQNINRSMKLDEQLAQNHKLNQYKYYVFSSFFPVEEDKLYKAGKVYVFRIRSLDFELVKKLKKLLPQAAQDFKVLASEIRIQKYRFITELCTITPALATVEGKHWVQSNDIMLLQERMHINLVKKYKSFYQEELSPSQSFIQRMDMLNRKPIALNYKGIKMIGNKFRLVVNEDEISQKLAFMAMATGLLEKNSSLGLGFCAAK